MADIHSLPVELLDLILSFVGSVTPPTSDERALRRIPSHDITFSNTADLKNMSRVCRRFQQYSREYLFSYCRYELRDQDRFLAFIQRHGLTARVWSVTITVRTIYPGSEKKQWWKTLFDHLDPEIVTVVAPPFLIAEIAQCRLEDTHTWAFDMPLQTMQFRQRPRRSLQVHSESPDGNYDTFLGSKPWTEMFFNEGSSLRAYSNYEYFLLRVPSIMNHWGSVDPLQAVELPYPVSAVSRLTAFHYAAVFPFYNHTNLVLKVIRNMSNLRYLSFQLAPVEGCDIFEVEQRTTTMDPNDAWMELHTSYSLIPHSVRYLGVQGSLVEFRTLDYNLPSLRRSTFKTMHAVLKSHWQDDGKGLWVKRPQPLASASSNDD